MKHAAKLLDLFIFRYLTQPRLRLSSHRPTDGHLQAYFDQPRLSRPEVFYDAPDTAPSIADSFTPVKRERNCDVYDFQFPSALSSPWPENNIVYGRYFKTRRSTDGPTTIMLHGWLAFNYLWYASLCRRLAAAGVNSLILQLPYHMDRRPGVSRYSGEFTISSDIPRTLEAIRQSVVDTRIAMNWLRAETSSPVGLWGVSLGGWVGALVTAMDPRLDFAVLMTPVVRPDDVMWHSELCPTVREGVASMGITSEELKDMLSIVTPKFFQPNLPPERILLVEAKIDQGVRPHTIEELWKTWGHPHRRRYAHGHISIIFSRRVVKETIDFIRSAT